MNRSVLLASVAGLAFVGAASADITTIDLNLGTIGAGAYGIAGTTVGASNDADNYAPVSSQIAIWNQDRVIQFTTLSSFTMSLTSNDPNGAGGGTDNDFFLLNSLVTVINGSNRNAATTIQSSIVEVSGSFGTFPAGTYYLVVDAWQGSPTSASHAGEFNAVLTLTEVPAPGAAALLGLGGVIVSRRRR